MKAVAVIPGKPNSVHLAELPKPASRTCRWDAACWCACSRSASTPPTARSTRPSTALRRRATISWCWGTNRSASSRQSGPNVTHVKPGDYVTATVRRPGGSIYDQIGTSDMTSEEVYYERGINLLHGFLTEYYVDDAEFIVSMPGGLEALARAGRADELRDQGRAASLRGAAPAARLAARRSPM